MPRIDLGSDLLNYIIKQNIQPGEKLPTINELKESDKLGISVGKVREQLEVARAMGLVDVRSKVGMTLRPYSFAPIARLSLLYALARDPRTFDQISDLRTHIEFVFWHQACETLQPDDFDTMQVCIEMAEKKLNDDWIRIPNDEHRTFHMTVFKRIDNPFVTGILEAYWDAYEASEANTYADYNYLRSVWDYHQRILDAIKRDDPDAAQALFLEHTRLLKHQVTDRSNNAKGAD